MRAAIALDHFVPCPLVLGSVLYLVMAVNDLQWAKKARSIPTYVLNADDDVTWVNYHLGLSAEDDDSGNDRKLLARFLSTYEDYDWDELDVEVQAAAETLGWNQEIWDKGGIAYTDNLSWSELTPEQQTAARVLGYSQATWDGTDADGTDSNNDGVGGNTAEEEGDVTYSVSSPNNHRYYDRCSGHRSRDQYPPRTDSQMG